jgi:putative flippase GtrA
MLDLRQRDWLPVIRYYAVGILNMAFGYMLFAILVALGMQVFVAQAVGYVIGVAFNYFTYSRLAFSGQQANRVFYLGSYVLNYLISVFLLWCILQILSSPYIAGILVTLIVSAINYVFLKTYVFRAREG